jgi:ribosomal protein S18 acetylase RimI-like enzyme
MEQQGIVPVEEGLRLRPFAGEPDVDAAVPWYADAATVAGVDGPVGRPYDRARVSSMYDALGTQGELYLVERNTASGWEPVGDVTLAPDMLPIVIAPAHRRRGIARAVLLRLVDRARVLGWEELRVCEIHPDDAPSQALFEGLGFIARAPAPPAYVLRLGPLAPRRRG